MDFYYDNSITFLRLLIAEWLRRKMQFCAGTSDILSLRRGSRLWDFLMGKSMNEIDKFKINAQTLTKTLNQ